MTRRVDITLAEIDERWRSLPAAERATLTGNSTLAAIEILARLRGMEMAEAEALGSPDRPQPVADAYDRLVRPGEPAGPALMRVFASVFSEEPEPVAP
jgi:hypothetical protein